MADAYPLSWPAGWPRTPSSQRNDGARFKQNSYSYEHRRLVEVTLDRARKLLFEELERLKARNVVLSSNVPLRADGMPRGDAGRASYQDPGAALYFTLKSRPIVMAQDAFTTPAANVRSLGLAIEAMRSLERHGGGTMMNKAFDGFSALPPPEGAPRKRPWWEVLRYPADPGEREFISVPEIEARFRFMAKNHHPDMGGSDAAMAELNDARREAIEAIGAGT